MKKILEDLKTYEQVMFFDTDIGGVVHNLAYLRFIETNRTLLAEKLGMPLKNMADKGIYPVLIKTEIEYKKPATLGDKLVIIGNVSEFQRVRFWCEFNIYHENNLDKSLIFCRQSLAIVKMPEGKPLRLNQHIKL